MKNAYNNEYNKIKGDLFMKLKKSIWLQTTIVGGILVFLSAFCIGLGGVADWIPSGKNHGVRFGLKAAISEYGAVWAGRNNGKCALIMIGCIIMAVLFAILCSIFLAKKKKYFGFIGMVVDILAILFFPFTVILANQLINAGAMTPVPMWIILIAVLALFVGQFEATVGLLLSPAIGAADAQEEAEEKPVEEEKPVFDEEAARRVADEEIKKAIAARESNEVKPLSEEEIKKIVDEAIAAHVEELHTEYVEEETPAEEPKEEEPAEEAEETSEETEIEEDPFGKLRAKKRASFETRLKKSDADLRHKYYDLRDYIKSYGVNNRISIPGDTFSAHRERLVFLTITGKHMKAYFALDPKDYEKSPIPVEGVDTKKFQDVPTCLRIKSDLSFRRAQKLADDLMAKKGLVKKEEDKPEQAAK